MKDGHVNKCKECNKKDVINNRDKNLEKYRAYDRMRNKLPERKAKHSEANNTWVKENPMKRKAATAVHNAIRDGKLSRPNYCEYCGISCKPHGHHSSYSKEMWLIVTWLCIDCHEQIHHPRD